MRDTTEKRENRQRTRTAARVEEAIRQLVDEGAHVSYYSVAERAQVARSTLYRREDLSALVDEAREKARRTPPSNKLAKLQHEVERLNKKVSTLCSQIPTTTYHFVNF